MPTNATEAPPRRCGSVAMAAAVMDPVRRPAGVAASQIAAAAAAAAISHQGSQTPKAIQTAAEPNVAMTNDALRMTVSLPRKHPAYSKVRRPPQNPQFSTAASARGWSHR